MRLVLPSATSGPSGYLLLRRSAVWASTDWFLFQGGRQQQCDRPVPRANGARFEAVNEVPFSRAVDNAGAAACCRVALEREGMGKARPRRCDQVTVLFVPVGTVVWGRKSTPTAKRGASLGRCPCRG